MTFSAATALVDAYLDHDEAMAGRAGTLIPKKEDRTHYKLGETIWRAICENWTEDAHGALSHEKVIKDLMEFRDRVGGALLDVIFAGPQQNG